MQFGLVLEPKRKALLLNCCFLADSPWPLPREREVVLVPFCRHVLRPVFLMIFPPGLTPRPPPSASPNKQVTGSTKHITLLVLKLHLYIFRERERRERYSIQSLYIRSIYLESQQTSCLRQRWCDLPYGIGFAAQFGSKINFSDVWLLKC